MTYIKKFVFSTVLLFSFLFIMIATGFAAEEKPQVIRVGFFDYLGFYEKAADGTYSGYGYDYLQEISKYTGWQYEFVPCSWNQCLDMVEHGKLDLLGLVLKTKDREDKYEFTSIDMGVSYIILTVKNTNEKLAFNESENVDGLTIALFRGNVQNELLREYCKINNIKIKEKLYDTQQEIVDAFNNGDVDAIVSSNLRKIDNERIIATFSPGPIYFVSTTGNREITDKINYALSNIKSHNPLFDNELFSKHYPRKKNSLLLLTKSELNYIQNAPIIDVVYYSNLKPLEYTNDKTKEFSGAVADVFKKIAYKTGLNFNYIPVQSRKQAYEYIASGKAEIMASTFGGVTSKKNVVSSLPYLKMQVLSIKGKGVTDIAGARLAVMDTQFDTLITARGNPENFQIVLCASAKECIDLINEGGADIAYINGYVAEYLLQNPELRNVALLPSLTDVTYELSIGISPTSDILLLPIINKAINSIIDTEYEEILFNNRIKEFYPTTLRTLIYSNTTEVIVIISAFLILLLMLFVLRRSMVQAKAANKSKSLFLAKMSHEIRTPINAIIGFLRLLKEEKLNRTCSEYVNIIEGSTKTLLELVNSILDITKVESGKLKLESNVFDLTNELNSIVSLFIGSMMENGVQFTAYIDPRIPAKIIGDQQKLTQIISNLLNNATKFTKTGGAIDFDVSVIGCKNNSVELRFAVKDSGIGIPKSEISNILSPFHQVEDGTISKQRGTGLGLTISNEFLKLMGSKIQIDSELGVGSEFYFIVKFQMIEPARPLKILTGRFGFIEIPQGECKFEKSLDILKPNLVKFDKIDEITNADLSGLDLIIVLRSPVYLDLASHIMAFRDKHPSIPVLILAYPMDSGRINILLEHNMSVLLRPMSVRALIDRVNELISKDTVKADNNIIATDKMQFEGKVLVAEDELINGKLITLVLAKYGLSAVVVQNGKEAVNFSREGYDLILMDINMPVMDGKEATSIIRQEEKGSGRKRVPIVALTANVMKGDEVEYLKLGIDSVLSKPYEVPALENVLLKYLKRV